MRRLLCLLELAAPRKERVLAGPGGAGASPLFAYLLTRIDAAFAGRACAAYGGVYIAASLMWLWVIEGKVPDRWDLLGAGACLIGAAVILFGPRPLA